MAGYRTRAHILRNRVFAPSVQQTVTETSSEMERVVVPEVRALLPELAEIRRILGDQGDAADEIAEITGRTLTRLSAEIADLQREMVELRAATTDLRAGLAGGRRAEPPLLNEDSPEFDRT